MNTNRSGLFWGILLIGAGALALARQLGYIDDSLPLVWEGIFAGVSLLALTNYALSGWKQWAWLFPAGVFGGLAVTVALASANIDNAAVASPLFLGLILPFAAAYLTDRSRNWWALIPGGVMTFLALVTLLVDSTGGDEWVGALFLFMIAISFLMVYLNNRIRTWALIVAYATAVLGLAPLMSTGGRDAAYFGPIFLFAVALPFFFVYFRFPENWWAIIPAGVVTTIAIIAALSISGIIRFEREEAFMTALLMAGLAVTFAVLWLRHDKAWAKIVTLILAALAVASVFFMSYYQILWPVAIILAGIYLFYTALRPKTA
ncbi:MAG: hypothetical protein EHM33_07430 [Chloroflexi bacterium]|nr:MAG: hypothetical protein EHM33_07430 [Chloroflexota bacterium]